MLLTVCAAGGCVVATPDGNVVFWPDVSFAAAGLATRGGDDGTIASPPRLPPVGVVDELPAAAVGQIGALWIGGVLGGEPGNALKDGKGEALMGAALVSAGSSGKLTGTGSGAGNTI